LCFKTLISGIKYLVTIIPQIIYTYIVICIILQTRELIEDLKSASGLEMQGGKGKLGADSKTLLRILCHRSDSEASQFLKKQFKIPKSSA
jgi:hypothetical protein